MSHPVIDSHHHFWDPEVGEFGWLSGPFAPIRRRFGPEDLRPLIAAAGVDATVLVQTQHDLRETAELLRFAAETDFIAGVVAWVDLADPGVGDSLAALRARPDGRYLVGIRHLVQDEPDPEWLLRGDVRRGLAAVEAAGLVYDLLPKAPQLAAALKTAVDFPGLRFVLDHIAKPDIAGGGFAPWKAAMAGFAAERGHVWCKLSGMVTEADWRAWSPDDLRPYVAEALRIFGTDRCLFGTDWPVCLVAASYAEVVGALDACLEGVGTAERTRIFGRNAVEAYRLPDFVAGS